MTTYLPVPTMTVDEILERYATNEHHWLGWQDHMISFKVGPATAEMHSPHQAFRTVYSVKVRRKRRGQGHGRRLMDVIVAYADAAGYGLNLEVLVDNEAAIRLYKSVGFRIICTGAGTHYMQRYPTRIPATPEWDAYFEAKALLLERDHEPRLGSDHWVAFFGALYKAQMAERDDLGRVRYSGSRNYDENTRRLHCDVTGAALLAAGWVVTRVEDVTA